MSDFRIAVEDLSGVPSLRQIEKLVTLVPLDLSMANFLEKNQTAERVQRQHASLMEQSKYAACTRLAGCVKSASI